MTNHFNFLSILSTMGPGKFSHFWALNVFHILGLGGGGGGRCFPRSVQLPLSAPHDPLLV